MKDKIHEETQGLVESYGSVQGVIHSVYMQAIPRHFIIRELSTKQLIKCIYASEQYQNLLEAFLSRMRDKKRVVHVNGSVKINMINHKIEQMIMQQIEIVENLSDKEFEDFFGFCPDLTGKLTTQEFIDQVRGSDKEFEDLAGKLTTLLRNYPNYKREEEGGEE